MNHLSTGLMNSGTSVLSHESLQEIERLAAGLFGDSKSLEQGVRELCVDYGPGYRVYFAQHGKQIILLLCGGDKGTQRKDIRKAIKYWQQWKANQ